MSYFRGKPGLKYGLGGAAFAALLIAVSLVLTVAGGGSTPPPAADGSTTQVSAPPVAPDFGATKGNNEPDNMAAVNTAVEFARAYYNLSYTDTTEGRKKALAPYATIAFLATMKLGFDPQVTADKAFVDSHSNQRCTIGEPIPGEISSGVDLPVDLITTSDSSKATTLSFIATIYLKQVNGKWKVVSLDDTQ